MNIVKGDSYTFKLAARAENFHGPLTVKLVSSTGAELASGEISGLTGDWQYHTLELDRAGGDPKAKLGDFRRRPRQRCSSTWFR